MDCPNCGESMVSPTSLAINLCATCRDGSHKECPLCHNKAIPPGGTDCGYCSIPGTPFHTSWAKYNVRKVATTSQSAPPVSWVGKKVKAIHGTAILKVGSIYTVELDPSPGSYLDRVRIKELNLDYDKAWFVLEQNSTYKSVAEHAVSKGLVDIDEEKCWQAMRPRRDSNECACGILRANCVYHS